MLVPNYDVLDGAEVWNDLDEKLGTVGGLFIDDVSSTPTWVAVRSGLFGRHHSLVPLAQALWAQERLLVPYTSDELSAAPHSDPDEPLDAEAEQQLFAYYNVGFSDRDRPGPHTGVDATDTGLVGTQDAGSHLVDFGSGEADAAGAPGVPGLPVTSMPPRLTRYQSPAQ